MPAASGCLTEPHRGRRPVDDGRRHPDRTAWPSRYVRLSPDLESGVIGRWNTARGSHQSAVSEKQPRLLSKSPIESLGDTGYSAS
ncbi:hypothetical protein BVI1335_180036 [Burkholderia vietnamiensis]|nr:hypothetical protein BVI1335_180036 [Burkholderia vietnamiensis]